MSCETSKSVDELPIIDFPDFPIDVDEVDIKVKEDSSYKYLSEITITWKNDSSKIVTLPYWFWEDLMGFMIDSEEAREKYEFLRSSYGVSKIPELQ